MDVPANTFMVAERAVDEGKSLMLATDCKNGFRGKESSMAVTLIRSSFDPDPYPEFGIHTFSLVLSVVDGGEKQNIELIRQGQLVNHELAAVSAPSNFCLASASYSFFGIEAGSVALSALKMPEDVSSVASCIVRLYETNGSSSNTVLRFSRKIAKAYFVDLNERAIDSVSEIRVDDNGRVSFTAPPFQIVSLCVVFE